MIFDSKKDLKRNLNNKEYKFVSKELQKRSIVKISVLEQLKFVVLLDLKSQESNRKLGAEIFETMPDQFSIFDLSSNSKEIICFLEGMMLKDYTFQKYKSKTKHKLKYVELVSSNVTKNIINELNSLIKGVFQARDWVNEPVNKLTTDQFIKEIKSLENIGVTVEVLRKSKLVELNMGGIIGVNQGSFDEPAFVKSEWKPKKIKKPETNCFNRKRCFI
jgi:leucyl aminopeptidase